MGCAEGAGKELGALHVEVVFYWQNAGLSVQMVFAGHEVGAGDDAECLVLDGLERLDV